MQTVGKGSERRNDVLRRVRERFEAYMEIHESSSQKHTPSEAGRVAHAGMFRSRSANYCFKFPAPLVCHWASMLVLEKILRVTKLAGLSIFIVQHEREAGHPSSIVASTAFHHAMGPRPCSAIEHYRASVKREVRLPRAA
jgi:hypothetical protein